ncbi:uncharacterized protein LOC134854576 [Symsagittifera roscoffensis]|uniref:uncharacterized protein LOC134854576 n=1 Tax=Symsagittifera roscoffensis TaxID=84072 RepID=UPI00307BE457
MTEREWSSDLFDCSDDLRTCCISWVLPCFVQGKIAEAIGESFFLHCVLYFVPCVNIYSLLSIRAKVREHKNISGGVCGDCCAFCCCFVCALTQEAREVTALSHMERT